MVRIAISKALKAFDLTNQWEWIAYESTIPPKATSLCKFRTGNCRDEADYLVYICRSLGIPSAVDFTPHWGNRSQSHSWSVLIKPDGSSTPFYMGTAPGDTITDRYRYLRYIGPNGSYCNINELVFYDEKGQQIKGKMIGTEGQPWASVEKVFDGDILTGFDAVSPDGHWVGLQPYSPSRVGKIRFIPRNDGNGVEIGDEYKLYYWHNDGWEEIANMKATRNELVFHKMPKGGLYVLRDMTKGHEERIFTYENGEQVWW